MSYNKTYTNLLLSRDQIEGILYVMDCYSQTETAHKYKEYAERVREKILKYGRVFGRDNEEMVALNMYETDMIIFVKLLSTYISAAQEMPKDYFLDVKNAFCVRNEKITET
ncbi:MAG: hypothetical protein IKW90_15925 [Lachnospiraceae bacterium]|nr:hypothetical protein [Lachnospiraceae bacterium]